MIPGTINGKPIIDAFSSSAWGFSTKITVVCGGCGCEWKTKEWQPITNCRNLIVAVCPRCGEYNNTGLVYSP